MWRCAYCGEQMEERLPVCSGCGVPRPGGVSAAGSVGLSEQAALIEAVLAHGVTDAAGPPPPQIEPPCASALAVWSWCLAVFALAPVLGIPVAGALAVCSAVLIIRREGLPWDRRVGLTGLAIAVAAFAAAGVWLVMLFIHPPLEWAQVEGIRAPAEQSWPVIATQVAVLVVSIMLHECAHAVAAYWSGDATAARLGRISLNPIRHVDLFGTIILPAILLMAPGGFVLGWAKPVPINPRQFRNPRRGLLAVTVAGVSVNLMLALACAAGLLALGSALRLVHPEATSQGFSTIFADCRILGGAASPAWELAITALKQGLIVNTILFTFNALPIPPLDGFGVLESLAPTSFAPLIGSLRSVGWILLIVLIATGILGYVLVPGYLFAFVLNELVGLATGWA